MSNNDFIVVDDDEMELDIVKLVYSRSKLTNSLRVFSGGNSFLEFWERVERGEEKTPAFVLIDVRMPAINGFEVVENLRARPRLPDQPQVALCSNSSDIVDRQRAVEVGADMYVVKPKGIQEYVQFFDELADTAP
ncbi:response regulator [Roseiconus lacunae]|uniref:Response regulator n=1 Tax=Roseiconus lacunae TaxID=2605694 RepID=A0ABT7PQZ2_9BACT|nr:response regulator [Roseiconus lacunae]MCD0460328.1 response regulator [Roseiconus lacunae]MDM4018930.1 response regulator [Roseiconus lacunae]WRQ51847.1 response regulator [Stieleria sp. HD01]